MNSHILYASIYLLSQIFYMKKTLFFKSIFAKCLHLCTYFTLRSNRFSISLNLTTSFFSVFDFFKINLLEIYNKHFESQFNVWTLDWFDFLCCDFVPWIPHFNCNQLTNSFKELTRQIISISCIDQLEDHNYFIRLQISSRFDRFVVYFYLWSRGKSSSAFVLVFICNLYEYVFVWFVIWLS